MARGCDSVVHALITIFEILGSIPEEQYERGEMLSSPFMSFFKCADLGDRYPKI